MSNQQKVNIDDYNIILSKEEEFESMEYLRLLAELEDVDFESMNGVCVSRQMTDEERERYGVKK